MHRIIIAVIIWQICQPGLSQVSGSVVEPSPVVRQHADELQESSFIALHSNSWLPANLVESDVPSSAATEDAAAENEFSCARGFKCSFVGGVCCPGGEYCCPHRCIRNRFTRTGVECVLSKKRRKKVTLTGVRSTREKAEATSSVSDAGSRILKRGPHVSTQQMEDVSVRGRKKPALAVAAGAVNNTKISITHSRNFAPWQVQRISSTSHGQLSDAMQVVKDLKTLARNTETCNLHLGGYLKPCKHCDEYFRNKEERKGIGKPVWPSLDVTKTIRAIHAIGRLDGINVTFVDKVKGGPIFKIRIPTINRNRLVPRILLSAGIHGNEPIGVTAALQLIALIADSSDLRDRFDFTIFPMLNPGGCRANSRYTQTQKDLNRRMTGHLIPLHMKHFAAFLQDRANTFDMAIDMHGARLKKGFYIIRASNRELELARNAIDIIPMYLRQQSATGQYPGYVGTGKDPKKYRFDAPGICVSDNTHTLKQYLHNHGDALAYTIEYPGLVPVCTRQLGMVTLVLSMINKLEAHLQQQ